MRPFQPTLPALGATSEFTLATAGIKFQPTLPARGATRKGQRAAGDFPDFNPRSPHGERRIDPMITCTLGEFQPTLPARGATRGCAVAIPQAAISTHAPRTGSDVPSLYAPMDT